MKLSMSRCEINVPVGLFGFGMKMRPRSRRDCIQHRIEVLLKVRARHLDHAGAKRTSRSVCKRQMHTQRRSRHPSPALRNA